MRDKLFFFDIDNTLARRGVIPDGNRDALMKHKNGIYKALEHEGIL